MLMRAIGSLVAKRFVSMKSRNVFSSADVSFVDSHVPSTVTRFKDAMKGSSSHIYLEMKSPNSFLALQQPKRRFSSSHNNFKHESGSGNEGPKSFNTIGVIGGTFTTLVGVGTFFFLVNEGLKEREQEIIIEVDPSTKSKSRSILDIVDSNEFEVIAPKVKGDLSGAVVRNKVTGNEYVKKGASDVDALWIEYVISNFLAQLYPGIQPECLIMREERPDGSSRLYTLSRKFANSMDLEDFIRQGNYKEKLAKKPLKGLARALAADLMFAEQSDIKYANLIVIEKEDAYYVATIDHEVSALRKETFFKGFSRCDFSLDLDYLLEHIRDLHFKDENNRAGLAGDPRAREFADLVREHMSQERLIEFYQKVAEHSSVDILTRIKKMNGRAGLLSEDHAAGLITRIQGVMNKAEVFLIKNNIEIEDSHEAALSHQSRRP